MNAENPNTVVSWLWKIPAIAVAYFFGVMIAGAVIVKTLGLQLAEMPGQSYVPFLSFLTAVVLSSTVAFLARGLGGAPVKRWLTLLAFFYIVFVVTNQIEAVVYTVMNEVPTMLFFFILPCMMATAACVLLIKPPNASETLPTVFSNRPLSSWWWRLVLAWLAFPVIYYFFGALIYPLVADFYSSPGTGFRVPSQLIIISAVSVRSLLFLAATIPILVNWHATRRSLVLSLAAALAAMVGVAGMFENTAMPMQMKLVHGTEIIADSLVHAWVLVALLVPKTLERLNISRENVSAHPTPPNTQR